MTSMKKALVTGASEGIGRVFSMRLAQAGYEVTVVARNGERLDSLLKDLPRVGHQKVVADLSTADGVKRVTDELRRNHYHLVINNAGFGGVSKFEQQPIEKIREMIRLNVLALVEISHAFAQTADRGDGIINVSSTLSFLPMPIQGVYSATKAFVTSFSESLGYEMRSKGVRVVNLCPGSTESQFGARAGIQSGDIPKVLTQTADEVVDAAMKALSNRGATTLVSGWINVMIVFVIRFLPRSAVVWGMGKARA